MDMKLTRLELSAGQWKGVLVSAKAPKILDIRLGSKRISTANISPTDQPDQWSVTFSLSADVLTDGAHCIVFVDAETNTTIGFETIVVGDAESGDLRGEVAQLRAELELLKRIVRRGFRNDQ